MSARRQISENIQNQVRQTANCLCEYCHASEKWQYVEFTIEHIIPITNRERVINIRAADKAIGRHPPAGDLIQSES